MRTSFTLRHSDTSEARITISFCRLSCTLISRAILDLRSKFGSAKRTQNDACYVYGPEEERPERGGAMPLVVRPFFADSVPSVSPCVVTEESAHSFSYFFPT